jgi:hypothetical protein
MATDDNIGIYKINVGNVYYIGSSTNLKWRKRNHIKALEENTHTNHKLQNEYNRTKTYEFTILTTCEWHEVRIIEQDYLDRYFNAPRCVNIERYAVSQRHKTRQLKPPKQKGNKRNDQTRNP